MLLYMLENLSHTQTNRFLSHYIDKSLAVKLESVYFSETLVSTPKSTLRHNPEE
jgi:hypothetical protein